MTFYTLSSSYSSSHYPLEQWSKHALRVSLFFSLLIERTNGEEEEKKPNEIHAYIYVYLKN